MLKSSTTTKWVVAITAGTLSFSYVMAGDHKNKSGKKEQGNRGRHGEHHASPTLPDGARPTPPGHHYGWERGRYNPHRSTTATPTPGVNPTPTPEVTATPTPTPTATPTPTP
jgi:hypothetical protein